MLTLPSLNTELASPGNIFSEPLTWPLLCPHGKTRTAGALQQN